MRSPRYAGNERRRLLVARVTQPARKAARERDGKVPYGGCRVIDDGGRGGAKGRELKIQRGSDQAKDHLQREAGNCLEGNLAVERGDAVCHGKDRAHERADEHGAHNGDVRIDIEADTRDQHGDNEDAQVRAG